MEITIVAKNGVVINVFSSDLNVSVDIIDIDTSIPTLDKEALRKLTELNRRAEMAEIYSVF